MNTLAIQQPERLNSALVSRFITYIQAKPKTAETYTRALRPFFEYMSSRSIQQPIRADIVAYADHLKNQTSEEGQARYKATTIQSYFAAIKRFFSWLEDEGLYRNIAKTVKSGAKVEKDFKKDALTSNQARRVLQTIDRSTLAGKRDFAILSLMMTAGLRTIEISRADIADKRTLDDMAVLFIQGKGKDEKNTFIKIAEPVERAIHEYISARGKHKAHEPLFTSTSNNSAGERMTTRSISAIVKAAFIRAGYDSDRITAHSLRHTAATLNLKNGATLEETQQLLRHSNINTTLIYAQHLKRLDNNSENRIAAAIF
jgi:integrase/recombinase XerC